MEHKWLAHQSAAEAIDSKASPNTCAQDNKLNYKFFDAEGQTGSACDRPAPSELGKWKIFVLNLNRATDRLAHMEAMLNRLNLQYERIAAVDGEELSSANITRLSSPRVFYWLFGRSMSRGELGCALSHRVAYQRILDEELDWALILEDDVELSSQIGRWLASVIHNTNNFDVTQLYFSENRFHPVKCIAKSDGIRIVSFTGPHASAVAYVVRRRGAQKLLRFRKAFLPADKFIWMTALNNIEFCGCLDYLARPHCTLNAASNIDRVDQILRHSGRHEGKLALWKLLVRPVVLLGRKLLVLRTHCRSPMS